MKNCNAGMRLRGFFGGLLLACLCSVLVIRTCGDDSEENFAVFCHQIFHYFMDNPRSFKGRGSAYFLKQRLLEDADEKRTPMGQVRPILELFERYAADPNKVSIDEKTRLKIALFNVVGGR